MRSPPWRGSTPRRPASRRRLPARARAPGAAPSERRIIEDGARDTFASDVAALTPWDAIRPSAKKGVEDRDEKADSKLVAEARAFVEGNGPWTDLGVRDAAIVGYILGHGGLKTYTSDKLVEAGTRALLSGHNADAKDARIAALSDAAERLNTAAGGAAVYSVPLETATATFVDSATKKGDRFEDVAGAKTGGSGAKRAATSGASAEVKAVLDDPDNYVPDYTDAKAAAAQRLAEAEAALAGIDIPEAPVFLSRIDATRNAYGNAFGTRGVRMTPEPTKPGTNSAPEPRAIPEARSVLDDYLDELEMSGDQTEAAKKLPPKIDTTAPGWKPKAQIAAEIATGARVDTTAPGWKPAAQIEAEKKAAEAKKAEDAKAAERVDTKAPGWKPAAQLRAETAADMDSGNWQPKPIREAKMREAEAIIAEPTPKPKPRGEAAADFLRSLAPAADDKADVLQLDEMTIEGDPQASHRPLLERHGLIARDGAVRSARASRLASTTAEGRAARAALDDNGGDLDKALGTLQDERAKAIAAALARKSA